MIFLEFLKGAALLLSLAMLHIFILRFWREESRAGRIASGLVFGGVAVIGMAMPLHLVPGVIFDPRSVVLAVAGFWGGPVVGVISGTVAMAYRLWLGGIGATMGAGVIVSSVAIGLVYRILCRHRGWPAGLWALLAFGLIVHGVVVLWMLTFPGDMAWAVMRKAAPPNLIVFAPATAILALLMSDLSRRFKTEDLLRESEARFAKAFRASPAAMSISRIDDGLNIDVNDQWQALVGYRREEAMGRNAAQLGVWPDMGQRAAFIERLRRDGSFRDFEATLRTKSGDFREVMVAGEIIEINGQPSLLLAFQDITERKKAEVALAESEARFRAIMEHSPVAIFMKDVDGRFLFANPAYLNRRGLAAEDIIGRLTDDFFGRAEADQIRQQERLVLEAREGRSFEVVRQWGGGEHQLLNVRFPVMGPASRPLGVGCLSFDITERKKAEAALAESEGRLRTLIDAMPAEVVFKDLDGRYRLVNKEFLRRNMRTEEYVIGRRSADVHPEALAATIAEQERETLAAGKPKTYELELAYGDGRQRTVTAVRFPIVGGDGATIGIGGAVIDITEQRALTVQLAHAQKMEVVGQLAGGTAHDFNNLLQVIMSSLEVMRPAGEGNDAILKPLETAMRAVLRGATLSQQLLSFSRRQVLRPQAVDPNGLVEGAVGLLQRTLGEDIEVVTGLEHGVRPILIDANGLENAILNLAINARAAMPRGGRLTMRTATRHLEDGMVTEDGVLPAGGYVTIAVSDTGCGMAPEVLAHAFEPFFTTKEVGEGSGLGLSMVYGFARQSGGHAMLESEVGEGTTVTLMFPAIEATRDSRRPAREADAVEAGVGTILLVEDDADVRRSVGILLRRLGYAVEEAGTGADALDILEHNPGIDLLFSDMVMPGGMSGLDLAREAVRRRPTLRVLLTSGYPEKMLDRAGLSEDEFTLLVKPYSNLKLRQAIRAVLAD